MLVGEKCFVYNIDGNIYKRKGAKEKEVTMKALVKNYYQQFVEEIDFPTIIFIYETGKVISYNKKALEMIGKPIINIKRLRAVNPEIRMTNGMFGNASSVMYNQKFHSENGMLIEIDYEVNSIQVQTMHLVVVFFEYSYKQAFCHGYRKLLPRAVWIDKKFQVMGCNETFRIEHGYSENEELPKELMAFLEEQTLQHMVEECRKLLDSKKPVFNTLQLIQPVRAKSYFCKLNCIPIYNKNDTVTGLLFVYKLVFNREEYERFFSASIRENNILNQMISNTNIIVVSWRKDIQYHIQYVSSNISNLGYTPEECYREKVKLIHMMSPKSYSDFCNNLKRIEEGPKNCFNQRVEMRRANGSLCWMNIYVGINKKSSRSNFYECFMQEIRPELYYRLQEPRESFSMALPLLDEDMRQMYKENQKEFCTYYQPIFSVETDEMLGIEAILRVRRGKDELVDPREVMTASEYIALRTSLGDLFMEQAIQSFLKWKRYCKDGCKLILELNAFQMVQPNYAQILEKLVLENEGNPEDILLEVKEGIAVEDISLMKDLLLEYRLRGFEFLLSGFTGGIMAMERIKEFELHYLKYDGRILQGYCSGKYASSLLEEEVRQIKNLGVSVFGEEVETKRQYEYLKQVGVCACQGNYLSVPLSYEHMTRKMKEK